MSLSSRLYSDHYRVTSVPLTDCYSTHTLFCLSHVLFYIAALVLILHTDSIQLWRVFFESNSSVALLSSTGSEFYLSPRGYRLIPIEQAPGSLPVSFCPFGLCPQMHLASSSVPDGHQLLQTVKFKFTGNGSQIATEKRM